MTFSIKPLHDGAIQVEDDAGHWLIFGLDDLRSKAIEVGASMVEGSPALPADRADLLAWAAFAAARGYAIEHGLIGDDRRPPATEVLRMAPETRS